MHRSLRFVLSGVLTLAIMLGISFAIPDPVQAHGTRITGFIVGCVIAAIPLYDIDRWSLTKRTLVHTLAMAVTVLPALIFSGWFDVQTVPGALAIVGIFIGFGAVGWTIGYVVHRATTREPTAQ